MTETFLTLGGFSTSLIVIVEFIKKHKNWKPWIIRGLSWTIGIVIAMLAWVLHFGIFDVIWWQAIIIGFGGSLISNGFATTEVIQNILILLKLIQKEDG